MQMSYLEAQTNMFEKQRELNTYIAIGANYSEIIASRGRYIASLQVLKKSAINEGINTTLIQNELDIQIKEHSRILKAYSRANKKGDYSLVKDVSIGVKSLINSVNQAKNARDDDDKKEAGKEIAKNVGLNIKNTVKAPVVLTTRILSSSIVATVLLAPVSIALGILHAAWTCIDSSPSPYEGKGAVKLSQGFNNVMKKLNSKVQKI